MNENRQSKFAIRLKYKWSYCCINTNITIITTVQLPSISLLFKQNHLFAAGGSHHLNINHYYYFISQRNVKTET